MDKNFYITAKPQDLGAISKEIDCELDSQFSDLLINNIASIGQAEEGDLTFLDNEKYLPYFGSTKASACIVSKDFVNKTSNQVILLRSKNPVLSYLKAVNLFYSSVKKYTNQIATSAYISKSASVGKNCNIGHNVVMEDNVAIGDDCIIEANTIIDCGVRIGNRAKIYSNVTISFSIIGDDVVILPGARIGQDGFGFATVNGAHHKIYHIGRVIIGNNVEIGANTTIDRGSINDTIIEDLCRIDNLVQIAHNVKVGRGSIVVAQTGIAGSTNIGKYCALGGQVGISGHLNIADKVQIAAQGGVMQNIDEESTIWGGAPVVPIKDWHRQTVIMRKLIRDKI